jgi:hypothetical protein
MNPESGHGLGAYLLAAPVQNFSMSHRAPVEYAAAVERGLRRRLRADERYPGLIAKNPLHAAWQVQWTTSQPYALGDLASALSRDDMRRESVRAHVSGMSRNCDVFDDTRRWAYQAVCAFKSSGESFGAWIQRCIEIAGGFNLQFANPMHLSEVRAIGRSIAKWTWCHFSVDRFSALQAIDLAWLRRRGARDIGYSGHITWSRHGEETASIGYDVVCNGLRLRYRHTPYGGTPQDVDEIIHIVTTPVPFGGCRHWFRCPSCNRRCRIVYGGARFRCRVCRCAKYESQYESEPLRLCSRRWRIRKLLEDHGGEKWPFGLDDGFPPKPRRMHWKTYRRLEALDEDLGSRWCIRIRGWLERTDPMQAAARRAHTRKS